MYTGIMTSRGRGNNDILTLCGPKDAITQKAKDWHKKNPDKSWYRLELDKCKKVGRNDGPKSWMRKDHWEVDEADRLWGIEDF